MTPAEHEFARVRWTSADLRAWRERLGLSQRAAAEEIGVSAEALQNYEQERRPMPAWLSRLCRYYERHGALD